MERRRSPAEVETSTEITSSVTCTRSESAICASLAEVEPVSRGLNLNLEQRDAKGSIILQEMDQPDAVKLQRGINIPRNVVAHQAKAGDSCVCFHDATQGALSILGHGISFVQYDYFIRWTGIGFPIRCYDLCAWSLSSKVLDLLSDYTNSTFVGCVQLQHTGLEVVRTK